MNYILRGLLVIVGVLWGCSCTSGPNWTRGAAVAPLVPEFSGGGRGAEVASKKAQLTAEYQALARAESLLKRERSSLAAMPPGRRGSAGMVATQRGAIDIDSRKVARHQARIAQLRRELMDAGVTITTHR